ncbi:MAG: hypothetical protein V7719_10460 [Psychroserpens sp.]|uniref:hypothetical protein n=1 Tax=Psychroserpens sp. TaxID=2020870 RepID=UPI003001E2DC
MNRRVHMYAGLIMIPYLFVFGLSALLFNHPTWLINRNSETFTLNEEHSFNNMFPNLDILANSVKDSLVDKGELFKGKITDVDYDNLMILRNINDLEDYRVKVDIPSSRIEIMSLPDFVDNTTVSRGHIKLDSLVSTYDLFENMENILREKQLIPGKSRVQRIPNLTFNVSHNDKDYKVEYNLTNGNYRVRNLNNREFKMNYFLVNLHQVHGYPTNGFSVKWMWVFFADCLAFLLIVWAISGLIMWYKMKRYFVIGTLVLCITIIISLYLLFSQYELGF